MTDKRPLFDQHLHRALLKVARGEIGTTSLTGALRHRSADLAPRLVSALFGLYRDGYVALRPSHSGDAWLPAELTPAGVKLLTEWQSQLLDVRAQAG
ncbi:MAG TPA: hypothetical protein VJ870_00460 [Amycolatopsis sp.]|nr:hypothetical protein [Amycolatopsis sp.]